MTFGCALDSLAETALIPVQYPPFRGDGVTRHRPHVPVTDSRTSTRVSDSLLGFVAAVLGAVMLLVVPVFGVVSAANAYGPVSNDRQASETQPTRPVPPSPRLALADQPAPIVAGR